jgi:hypothetical protein
LKLYTEFVFAFAVHAVGERHERKVREWIDAGIRVSWFKHTKVTAEAIEAMFRTVSFSLDENLSDTKKDGYADFDYLRDHPYFLFEEALYCLDYEFSFGKLESGVLWRMLRHVPNGGDYLTFWGSVFEYYVAWLFETYAATRIHKVFVSPTYADDRSKQICDVIVVSDGTAILIEAKLATCRSDVRYAGDYYGLAGAAFVVPLNTALERLYPYSFTALPFLAQLNFSVTLAFSNSVSYKVLIKVPFVFVTVAKAPRRVEPVSPRSL